MKRLLLLVLTATTFFAISGFDVSGKKIDKKLIGTWKGFEKDGQQEGMEKHWIMQRSKDGTFYLMFTAVENCEVTTVVEKGKWWTEEGKFYEYHENTKLTDVYQYEVVDGLMVKFKSIVMLGEEKESYEFTDYKLE